MKVSLIIPILETEPQLDETLRGLNRLRDSLDLEILLVVDVPDSTRWERVRAANDGVATPAAARVLYRRGAIGFGSALRAGFTDASGDVLIPVMADGSEEPGDILRLVRELDRGWDIVGGARYAKGGKVIGDSAKQRLSRWYSVLMRAAGGPPIHDVSNSFKAYRREVVERVQTVARSFDFSVEVTLKAARMGFRVGEVPTTWTTRREGRSNFRMLRELPHYARWLWVAASSRRASMKTRAGPAGRGRGAGPTVR